MKNLRELFILLILFAFIDLCKTQEEIIFQTEGNSFSPLITLKSEAYVRWTFDDGDTSNSLNPVKVYGSEATRINRLYVHPWSALKMINIGYDAGDGGAYNIPFISDQHVSKVQNLDLVKDYLEIWCSSYNMLDTLIFDSFVLLDTVECFLSQTVKHVSLKNTPSLTRLCLEDNDLTSLDISGCTGLMDLRGAVNNYSTIQFSESTEEIWHICIRDNPQITNDTLFKNIDKFPNLTELFIWNTNQKGSFKAYNCFINSWVTIRAEGNHYTTLDLSGGIIQGDGGSWVTFNDNNLKSVNIEGFSEIYHLELNNNGMASDTVDKILFQADQLGIDGSADKLISLFGNEMPTPTGIAYKKNLEKKGWIIQVEGPRIIISNNDMIIQLNDIFLFDSTAVGDSVLISFTITNPGSYDLNLTGNPIAAIDGKNASDFKVSSYPSSTINSWDGTTTFEIMFKPTTVGNKEAVMTIENDGVDNKNTYSFSIRGVGVGTNYIDGKMTNNRYLIYPNPGNGIFDINIPDYNQNYDIIILNNLGIVIYNKKYDNKTVNLSSSGKGIYYLIIRNEQNTISKKVIIE